MTAKQKAARAKFKQVVAEAKKLRKKNPKLTQAQAVKQAWAIEYKKAPKKVAEVGKVAKKKAVKKKAASKKVAKKIATPKGKKPMQDKKAVKSYHKDTKSHNVNIRVVSGLHRINGIEPSDFTRINNDTYGNPRYVIHFLQLLNDQERMIPSIDEKYRVALKKGKKLGGKKFSNKQYGGGIVFQSYDIYGLSEKLDKLRNS